MTILKNERLPVGGFEIDPLVHELRSAANMRTPGVRDAVRIFDEAINECPWCDEDFDFDNAEFDAHDGAYVCPSCSKLFAREVDEQGNSITAPRMSRQDRDYLLWLKQREAK